MVLVALDSIGASRTIFKLREYKTHGLRSVRRTHCFDKLEKYFCQRLESKNLIFIVSYRSYLKVDKCRKYLLLFTDYNLADVKLLNTCTYMQRK